SSNASLSTSKAPFSRQRSVRRVDPNHPITPSGREIIQYCFESAHNDLGHRICTRLYEKRPDYQRFIQTMGKDKWPQMTNNLKCFLENVVVNIDSLQMIERLSRQYGEEHVEVKVYGFKPDFWVSLADAIIIECVILDQANHQPTDTVSAWSQLVTLMFTSIRDGYYHALRTQRISTRKKNLQRQESIGTVEDSPERSTNGEVRPSPRPASLYVNNRQSVSVPNGLSPPAASGRAFNKSESQSPTMMTRPIFE
ncbi:Protein GLB-20, partial [Aphelenchoides avenae]